MRLNEKREAQKVNLDQDLLIHYCITNNYPNINLLLSKSSIDLLILR